MLLTLLPKTPGSIPPPNPGSDKPADAPSIGMTAYPSGPVAAAVCK